MGGANGQLKGGIHLKADDGTPMANVMLTAMHKIGMNVESFGDSTGEFSSGVGSGLTTQARRSSSEHRALSPEPEPS
jgi:hypothetical protein